MSKYMQEVMSRLVDVPMARMFVLASIIFLLVAVLGRIEGKIEPGKIGRLGAIIVGVFLLGSGMAMHFNETDALRDKLRENMNLAPVASTQLAMNAPGVSVASASAAPAGTAAPSKGVAAEVAVKVLSASYGGNCGAASGNATAQVARACDGQARCEFRVDSAASEDPAGCAKILTAEWKCGSAATVYAVTLPAGASPGEPLRLACMAP